MQNKLDLRCCVHWRKTCPVSGSYRWSLDIVSLVVQRNRAREQGNAGAHELEDEDILTAIEAVPSESFLWSCTIIFAEISLRFLFLPNQGTFILAFLLWPGLMYDKLSSSSLVDLDAVTTNGEVNGTTYFLWRSHFYRWPRHQAAIALFKLRHDASHRIYLDGACAVIITLLV